MNCGKAPRLLNDLLLEEGLLNINLFEKASVMELSYYGYFNAGLKTLL
jgi:hypothetical protein